MDIYQEVHLLAVLTTTDEWTDFVHAFVDDVLPKAIDNSHILYGQFADI